MLHRLCHDFASTIFCLTVPKKFVGDFSVLCFNKILFTIKFMDEREREV